MTNGRLKAYHQKRDFRRTREPRGGGFYDFACRSAQEGVMCKRASSPYLQKRTRDWLKVKCVRRQKFVIGGYTDPSGGRFGFGSILLGVYIKDMPGLIELVQLGTLELHPWGSRVEQTITKRALRAMGVEP